jgi:hypothetical protein
MGENDPVVARKRFHRQFLRSDFRDLKKVPETGTFDVGRPEISLVSDDHASDKVILAGE